MNPIVKRLRAHAIDAKSIALISPVVRVRARFGSAWAAWGSGFFIGPWTSSVITARHVVALAQGVAPTDVMVHAFVDETWMPLDVETVAFPSGAGVDDLAIVRIAGTCTSNLQAAALDRLSPVEVWGYPLGVGRPRGGPAVVKTRARPVAPRIRLDGQAHVGMSGGPVIAISEAGDPIAAVGIYLGAGPEGGRAQVLSADSLLACKDAAMNCP